MYIYICIYTCIFFASGCYDVQQHPSLFCGRYFICIYRYIDDYKCMFGKQLYIDI